MGFAGISDELSAVETPRGTPMCAGAGQWDGRTLRGDADGRMHSCGRDHGVPRLEYSNLMSAQKTNKLATHRCQPQSPLWRGIGQII